MDRKPAELVRPGRNFISIRHNAQTGLYEVLKLKDRNQVRGELQCACATEQEAERAARMMIAARDLNEVPEVEG